MVTSQLLKMELGNRRSGTTHPSHQAWPVADHASTQFTLALQGTTRPGVPTNDRALRVG